MPAFRRHTFIRFGLVGCCVVFGFLILSCRPAPPTSGKPLRVGIDLWAGYYPLVLADELGYLKSEGVALELQAPQDTHRMVADFAAHKHDLICVALGDIVLATRVEPDLRLILCSDESAGADQVLGHGELRDASQIRGKRIGTTAGGFGELLVRRFLDRHGVRTNEVSLVTADAAAVPQLLKKGELDIGHTWEPYAAEARRDGATTWFTSAETPGLILDGMVARGDVIRERRAEVQGLVRAWFRALDWWRAHPTEGNNLIARRMKIALETISLDGIRLHDRADNRKLFSPTASPSLKAATSEFVEFFITRGTLGRRLTPEDLLDPQFIE